MTVPDPGESRILEDRVFLFLLIAVILLRPQGLLGRVEERTV